MGRDAETLLDAYLVAACRGGDGRALERLYRRWQPKLLSHAARLLGDRELARDCVQEAWVEILRSLPRLRDDYAFAPFVFRITSRRCARTIRTMQAHRRKLDAFASEPIPRSVPPPEDGLGDTVRMALRDALLDLPPPQRATVALFYLQDMSVSEVARSLDVPMGTVKTRLMHARKRLRAALERTTDE